MHKCEMIIYMNFEDHTLKIFIILDNIIAETHSIRKNLRISSAYVFRIKFSSSMYALNEI